ncbi:MAG: Eco57I restriction-modification methylase domain-containing protein, partial [Candidatus Hodarchaeales archaeon]
SLIRTYTHRDKIISYGWGFIILELIQSMKINLIESPFEEDIFDWWNTELFSLKNKELKDLLSTTKNPELEEFCLALGELILNILKYDFSEIIGDPLGDLYQNYFDKYTRKSLGEFYTPEEVVLYILDNVKYNNEFILNKRLIDPSCGSGTFLIEALKRYLHFANEKEDKSNPIYWSQTLKKLCYEFHIVGLDIHPFAVIMSQIQFMLILVPYLKKAILEDPDFVIKRLPVFRTDSLWDVSKYKEEVGKALKKWIMEESKDDIILKLHMPIKIKDDYLEISIKMPKTNKVYKNTDIYNIKEYFLALQSMFDTIKLVYRKDVYTIDEKVFKNNLLQYLDNKDWNKLVSFFKPYADDILKIIKDLKYKFGDGRLVKSIEDVMLSGLIKTPDYVNYDYVVGNPPYVNIRMILDYQKEHYNEVYYTAQGLYDLYCLFIEKAINLLSNNGYLGYITSNQFFLTEYGEFLREFLTKKANYFCLIEKIIDFRDTTIFSDVINYPCILIVNKSDNEAKYNDNEIDFVRVKENVEDFFEILSKSKDDKTNYFDKFLYKQSLLSKSNWHLMPSDEKKLFDLLYEKSDLKLEDITDNIFVGTQTSLDKVYLVKKTEIDEKGISKIKPNGFKKSEFEIESKMLKPLLKGKDISKWTLEWSQNWLVFPYDNIDKKKILPIDVLKKEFPKTWDYFQHFEKEIKSRESGRFKDNEEWYVFGRANNHEKFEQRKMISQLLSQENRFSLDEEGNFFFIAVGGNCITLKETYSEENNYLYFLAILNSNLASFIMKHISPVHEGGYYLYIFGYIKNIPLKLFSVDQAQYNLIIENVNKILLCKKVERKTQFFPQSYIEALKTPDLELEIKNLKFQKNYRSLVISHKKNEGNDGYSIIFNDEDEIIKLETENEVKFVKYYLTGKKIQKSVVRVLIPKGKYLREVIQKYEEDLHTLRACDVSKIEVELNKVIYQIYSLNQDEIDLIENFISSY